MVLAYLVSKTTFGTLTFVPKNDFDVSPAETKAIEFKNKDSLANVPVIIFG